METQLSFEDVKKKLENVEDEPVEPIENLVGDKLHKFVEIDPNEATPAICLTEIVEDTHVPLTEEQVQEIVKKGLEEIDELRKDETEYQRLKRKAEYCKVISLFDLNEPVYSNVKEMNSLTKLKYTEKVKSYFDFDIGFLEDRFNTIMRCVLIDGDVGEIPM